MRSSRKISPLTTDNLDFPSQLLWFEEEAWLYRTKDDAPCHLHAFPDGLQVPTAAYWPLVDPQPAQRQANESYTLYLAGSSNGLHAGWSVAITNVECSEEVFIGCMYGTLQLADNIASDLSALAIAQNLAVRWPVPCSFCIRPDLSLS